MSIILRIDDFYIYQAVLRFPTVQPKVSDTLVLIVYEEDEHHLLFVPERLVPKYSDSLIIS